MEKNNNVNNFCTYGLHISPQGGFEVSSPGRNVKFPGQKYEAPGEKCEAPWGKCEAPTGRNVKPPGGNVKPPREKCEAHMHKNIYIFFIFLHYI